MAEIEIASSGIIRVEKRIEIVTLNEGDLVLIASKNSRNSSDRSLKIGRVSQYRILKPSEGAQYLRPRRIIELSPACRLRSLSRSDSPNLYVLDWDRASVSHIALLRCGEREVLGELASRRDYVGYIPEVRKFFSI